MSELVGYIASGKDGKTEASKATTPPAHNGNGGNER